MNDPAREPRLEPVPVPAAIECPQCGTPLRLLRPATVHTPIACCICKATFYMQPVETAPLTEPLNGNGPAKPAFPARPGQRPVPPRPPERKPRSPDDPPPAMTTPPPPTLGSRPAGMPRPVQLPEHIQRTFRTKTLESLLGISLVLLFVIGLCAGGLLLIKWHNDRSRPTQDDRPGVAAEEPGPAAEAMSIESGPKALARPAALFGEWESRADDGSVSSFTFWPDGQVKIIPASETPRPPVEGNWFVVRHKDDEFQIEVGPNVGTFGNTQITLVMTGPDAFTITRQIYHGLPASSNQLRYIRLRSVPAEPPAKPAPKADKAQPAEPSPDPAAR